jgi:hypothetical protein
MDGAIQNPFAILTLIVAPAILTNASSILAMSTSNRFLRVSDRMRSLTTRLETNGKPEATKSLLIVQVGRAEQQARFLLNALRAIYVSLGSFAGASLISIFGAIAASVSWQAIQRLTISAALLVGCVGVGAIIWSCLNLFRATRLSLLNISDEAQLVLEAHAPQRSNFAIGRPKTACVSND